MILYYIYASHHSHPWSIYPLVLCTHLLAKVAWETKHNVSLLTTTDIFYFHQCSRESSVVSFPPILRLLDNVYVRSVWAKPIDG